ncbi:putative ribonuclease H-like domain-containing protein, partial [Tanacetum coccineum]
MTASSTSSTNYVNTAKPAYEVSTVSPNVNTASLQDLEQYHKDDLKAMDLKWQLSAKYEDKESTKDKEGQFRIKTTLGSMEKIEDTSSKAMLAIDGVGFDWSDMAEEQVQANMAIMTFSDFEEFDHVQAHCNTIKGKGWIARTMLADSKLPTTFWAEAISTACYVQNRVLVVKPHNKTPYELFRGFKPALSFMRPFGCHVTILNTLDSLGKFDGKSDEVFLLDYSLKNKPMIEGNGPKWLFDIDSLTQSMNYVPIAADTISNESAGTQEEFNAGTSIQKEEISQDCIVEDGLDNENDEKDKYKDDSSPKEVNTAGQHVNTTSPEVNTDHFKLNTVDPSVNTASSSDPDSPKDMFTMGASHTLEATHVEFFSDEDEPKVDLGNILNSYTVSTTPNTRIHKDHPIKNVIGDVKSSVQTRRMTKPTSEQGFLSAVYKEKTHDTLNTCLYACFLSQIKPISIAKVLSDSYWVKAMQEELLQFKLQQVWKLLDFPNGKRDIGKKWVFRNKKDERGIVIKNKARLELCTAFEKLMKDKFQMSSIGELTFFLGLQVQQKEDGIFISQDKYVAEILKKFNYTDVKSASTPVDLEKPLVKDEDADDVDVHLYRSMIGSLMYLTSSRLDIMFAVCACARFQVTTKTSHLLAIKRIFRYLKGKPTLGLWYSKDSLFELVAYTNSDYARATQDRKSTTGGCQFLGNRHVKIGQDTKIPQSSGPLVKVGEEAVHKELGDRMERAATTASSLEVEQDSATSRTIDDGEVEISASIDGQVKTITEASLRRHLKLEDSDGITSLPNTEIFEQLALVGYVSDSARFTFQKGHFSPQWRFFIHIILHYLNEATFTSMDVDAGGAATTDIALDVGQGSGTIHKTPTRPYDLPLLRFHTLGSDEGSLQQNELMDLVTKLTDRVEVLENDMQQTKKVYSSTLTKLILRVKKLEKKVKPNKARRRARIVILEDEDAEEDSSKQGRKISKIDKDPTISLVQPEQDMEYDFYVSTAEGFTTASVPVTT